MSKYILVAELIINYNFQVWRQVFLKIFNQQIYKKDFMSSGQYLINFNLLI